MTLKVDAVDPMNVPPPTDVRGFSPCQAAVVRPSNSGSRNGLTISDSDVEDGNVRISASSSSEYNLYGDGGKGTTDGRRKRDGTLESLGAETRSSGTCTTRETKWYNNPRAGGGKKVQNDMNSTSRPSVADASTSAQEESSMLWSIATTLLNLGSSQAHNLIKLSLSKVSVRSASDQPEVLAVAKNSECDEEIAQLNTTSADVAAGSGCRVRLLNHMGVGPIRRASKLLQEVKIHEPMTQDSCKKKFDPLVCGPGQNFARTAIVARELALARCSARPGPKSPSGSPPLPSTLRSSRKQRTSTILSEKLGKSRFATLQ